MNVNQTFKILAIYNSSISLFILLSPFPMNSHFGSRRPCTISSDYYYLQRVKSSLLPISTGGKLVKIFWKTNKIIF